MSGAPNLANPAELVGVLSMLSVNDTEVVKRGEKMLEAFLKHPGCLAALMHQVGQSSDVAVRTHAALLLKKRIFKHYKKFPQNEQQQLKAQLLGLMVAEPNKAASTALAGAVAMLAKAIFSAEQSWEELFQTLLQLAQNPNEALRALDYNLLGQLAEHVAGYLKPHMTTIAQMFVAGCNDPSAAVKKEAMGATTSFLKELADLPEVMHLECVIPPMIEVMQQCLASGDEDVVAEGLDVIQESLASEQPLANNHLERLVPFVMTILQTDQYDVAVKQSAGQTIMTIVENRPKLLAKKQLVAPILAAMVQMIAASDASAAGSLFSHHNHDGILKDEENDDDDDDEDYTPEMELTRLSQMIIDVMAISIPSKHFLQPALSLAAQGMSSQDANMRKAGCAVLGVIAEGCCDDLRQILPQILPALLQGVQDPEYFVREVACFALGQFAEHCQPDILHHNQQVLPVIFLALDDPRPTIQSTSCYALEMFCENLQPETLRPFLVPLMTKLATLIQSEERTTREMALTAMASTAVAAELEFLPFTPAICSIIQQMIFITDPKQFSLRGRALECLGHIALAIGKDNFQPYFAMGMQSAAEGLRMEDENDVLKEFSYVFIANAAKAMGKEMAPLLGEIIPTLITVVMESEVVYQDDEDNEQDGGGGGSAASAVTTTSGAEDLDDDDEDEDDQVFVNFGEAFINGKKAALTALGALAEHTGEHFFPHLPGTLECLTHDVVYESTHEAIRAESVAILQHLVTAAATQQGIVEPATREKPVVSLSAATTEVAQKSLLYCLKAIENDPSKKTVAAAVESISGILTHLGAVALHLPCVEEGENWDGPVANVLLVLVLKLLSEKSECQTQKVAADTCIYIYIYKINIHIYTYTHTDMHKHTHAHTNTRTHTHKHLFHKYAHTHTHTHIHTYTYTHTHTHIHTKVEHDDDEEDDHDSLVIDAVSDLIGVLARVIGPGFEQYFDTMKDPLLKYCKPSRPHTDRSMALGCFAEVLID